MADDKARKDNADLMGDDLPREEREDLQQTIAESDKDSSRKETA